MDKDESISSRTLARLVQALDEFCDRRLPQVSLIEPNQDVNEKPALVTKVDWFPLFKIFGTELASRSVQIDLFEEAAYNLAARSGLVAVKKVLPLHGLTLEEQSLIALVKKPSNEIVEGFYHGTFDIGSEPPSNDWVQEGTVLLVEFPPDDHLPLPSADFVRFVAVDALTPRHLPYVENFLYRALEGPPQYTIEATDEVMFVVDVLKDLDIL